MKNKRIFILIFAILFSFILALNYFREEKVPEFPETGTITDGTINSTFRYAWGENIGWIDFGTENGEVTVTDSILTGYAWSETTGWISLNCSNTSSCAIVDYKVSNNSEGTLSGYAWSENTGWIDFNPTGGGVIINYSGDFSGYAWGENTGWIVFNCSTTNSCGTVSYKINTDWRPASSRIGSGGPLVEYSNSPPVPNPIIPAPLPVNIIEEHTIVPPLPNPIIPAPLPVTIIEQHTIPRETPVVVKDNSKNSPDRSDNSSGTEETSKTPNEEPPAPLTSRVEVVIVDTKQEPVEGATVTLHSTPRTITTAKDGKAIFENVKPGDHRLVVSYRGQEGEQEINLDESIAEFQFKIQIEAQNTFVVFGMLALVIAFLTFFIIKKYKRVNY